MIRSLNSGNILNREEVGNKALNLNIMTNAEINVPAGIILDSDEYRKHIEKSSLSTEINKLLQGLNSSNIKEVEDAIEKMISKTRIDKETLYSIIDKLDKNKKYAVRSSATKEDLGDLSFAGQYTTKLYVSCDLDSIEWAILDCYKSLLSETSLSYIVNNNIDYNDLSMSVVIQEMIDADYSGICFTLNPLTGKDTEMIMEVASGIGENIVSGRVKPEQYMYDWRTKEAYIDKEKSKLAYSRSNKILDLDTVKRYGEEFLKIQLLFGYPCDIEFAVKDNKLYILQARQITTVDYLGYNQVWTTADFKEGGVSATACKQYMWSLYEYIWEYTLRKFITDSHILSNKEIGTRKLGEMFFGRCYWNLSVVKKAMSKVVGYKEREFDNEYGIAPTYKGDGETTGFTIKSLSKIAVMAYYQNKILKERNNNHMKYREELLKTYEYYKYRYDTNMITDIEKEWYELTKNEYLKSEPTYFWQIFINTIHQSLYKGRLLKYVSEGEYLKLLCSLDSVSHLLPFHEIWDITRNIRKDERALAYWKNTDAKYIVDRLKENKDCYCNIDIERFLVYYGHHSDKELDVSYPCYYEDYMPVVSMIKSTLLLDDKYSPNNDIERGKEEYTVILDRLKSTLSSRKFNKIDNKIKEMRKMLWWREEYRDISTKFYYIIRVYTIKLAEHLIEKEVLTDVNDIWYIKVSDLWDYINGLLSKEKLIKSLNSNKEYYNAFRNYMSDNEIGGSSYASSKKSENKGCIKGIGANSGIVTGTARVIENFDEIDRLQQDDILVTKFTDTGWTPKFAAISGIVTEFGGILCHAAIVSREYNIPAIVNCTDVLSKIKDGDTITINGETGEVIVNT